MRLNNLFTPKNKRTSPEYFLAVEIHESLIKSAVWQVEEETPSIVALGSYELWDSEDSLINGVDASLTAATKGLDIPPDRVIFGLPDSWLVENKIHTTKQKLIQHLLKELSLKPIGLVTISEAIVSQLKSQEGVPPTAILLEIYPSKVIVSLVNTGEIQALEEVGRSDDLARDVEEGLARFDVEKLPARFILTNGSDLENEEQQIISYSWTDKLPFIHLPKVQTLPIDFSIKAIALSGGSEAAKSLGLAIAATTMEPPQSQPQPDVDNFLVENKPQEEQLQEIGFSLEEENTPLPPPEEETLPAPAPPKIHFLAKLARFRPHLHFSLPKVNFIPSRRFAFIAVPLLLLLVLTGVVSYYFFFGQVEISLSITPQRLSQDLDLTITSGQAGDSLTIQAAKKTLSGKASDSVTTSGEATVGDKAIGKVTLYNLSPEAINLKAGSKVTSSSGLAFILDQAVSIASRSAEQQPPFTITPGSISVNVTAAKIGAESNQDKGAQFSVENYPKSVVIASADVSFSGGSSRTVKAVTKTDQEKVLGAATDKIKSEISDQLKKQDPDSRFVSLGALHYSAKNFDHNPGEEAATLSLDLEGQQDILVYSYRQMIDALSQKIKSSLAPGLLISDKDLNISLGDPSPKGDNAFISKAHIEALLLPTIDQNRIIDQYKGKKAEGLKTILQSIPGFRTAKVIINPPLPLISDYLPRNPKNFHFTISALP